MLNQFHRFSLNSYLIFVPILLGNLIMAGRFYMKKGFDPGSKRFLFGFRKDAPWM